jgi:hypothetical protein
VTPTYVDVDEAVERKPSTDPWDHLFCCWRSGSVDWRARARPSISFVSTFSFIQTERCISFTGKKTMCLPVAGKAPCRRRCSVAGRYVSARASDGPPRDARCLLSNACGLSQLQYVNTEYATRILNCDRPIARSSCTNGRACLHAW